ncbi:hypothetical protein HN51_031997 [Arachis hypogaea]|uniref:Two-component response regulator-like APRR5 n=1 Tax=Arachis hypogaea TaxID=3818 RepID=A0A445B698_ARAHY|nr:two-component response regulator-like APRR5 isoform X1 [Arachis hypogaea]QHO16273.1 Two-component response regulator-like [Arachis hypogaea]RYR34199.1 hypothetical protein Ahy_A10g048937 [Arachis hypogaea]
MGEVVVSERLVGTAEEEEKQTTTVAAAEEETTATEGKGGGGESKGLMRWEKFLPKMVLRVLLVEADDSTRQIIAALLRKCSYKVAAVPDGLKAWEILKGRPRNIDLILTEVDLPAISGYALLTLIMEHDICKNIPVIMMSSQDSISTVYKCMLRGAADYLVKPLRKNELRNLWQHVWRRQSSTVAMNGLQDESVAQQKVEATAENNDASIRSSGDAASIQRNKELIEKGSDAQSSCTKPDLEAESGPVDNMQEFASLKCGESYPTGTMTQEVETCMRLGQISVMHDSHAGGLAMASSKNCETSTTNGKDGDTEHFRSATICGEAHDNHCVQISCSKEAIDLIGAFHNRPNCSLKTPTVNCTGKFDFIPQLDLSLRRPHPSNCDNELAEERNTIMHSNASAFKRYTNKQFQASPAILNFSDQQREQRTNCEKSISHFATGCNSESSTPSVQRNLLSPTTPQSKESEAATSHSQQQGHSLPIAVKGVRFNDLCTAYGSVLPPMFRTQSGPPLVPSPSSVVLLEPAFQVNGFYQSSVKDNSSEQVYESPSSGGKSAPNNMISRPEHKPEHAEDRRHISPATDQSGSGSFCNGNASHLNSMGYGSNCGSSNIVDQVPIGRAASEGKNEEMANNASSHRSIQREAALNKFRLKRKERCYEKKVRYESRKKLAEQRPRVKGQFVRQVQPDALTAEKDGKEYDL